ncbi:MAG: helix-turn-helix domain-containing protein [Firmicutes bacterium]|nr:helix-turn-helix domain-containing protein [Bacillota bacterium]
MSLFGENLKKLRIDSGTTQKRLAEKLSVTDRSIRDWENEKTEPSYDTLIRIADIFDCSLDELLGRE